MRMTVDNSTVAISVAMTSLLDGSVFTPGPQGDPSFLYVAGAVSGGNCAGQAQVLSLPNGGSGTFLIELPIDNFCLGSDITFFQTVVARCTVTIGNCFGPSGQDLGPRPFPAAVGTCFLDTAGTQTIGLGFGVTQADGGITAFGVTTTVFVADAPITFIRQFDLLTGPVDTIAPGVTGACYLSQNFTGTGATHNFSTTANVLTVTSQGPVAISMFPTLAFSVEGNENGGGGGGGGSSGGGVGGGP
jgi:hypothetical protein